MITPTLIQVMFWIGVVVSIVGAYVFAHAASAPFAARVLVAFGILVLGPLIVRILCESAIVRFRMYEELVEIRRRHPSG